MYHHHACGVPRGGGAGGGHGPRAQALEVAPAQLVGANFKKKIRPRQARSHGGARGAEPPPLEKFEPPLAGLGCPP